MFKKEKEKKQINNSEFSVSYINETNISNGNLESATYVDNDFEPIIFSLTFSEAELKNLNIDVDDPKYGKCSIENNENGRYYTFRKIFTLENVFNFPTLEDLRKSYSENGESASKLYQNVKNFLAENKENPLLVREAISKLLSDISNNYDNSISHSGLKGNDIKNFETVLNAEEEESIKGFICGPIHEMVMKLLNEAGYEATLLGGFNPGSTGHITLLWKDSDGKYVFNDYSKQCVINAPSIKDAISEINKRGSSLFGFPGYYYLYNGNKSSYQEFLFDKEVAFGDNFDKKASDKISPFNYGKLSKENSIRGNVQISNLGNISSNAGINFVNRDSNEVNIDFEYKKNNETANFISSQSFGVKADVKTLKKDENSTKYSEIKGIISYLDATTSNGEYNLTTSVLEKKNNLSDEMNNWFNLFGADINYSFISKKSYPTEKHNFLLGSTKFIYGEKRTISDSESLKVESVTQASLDGGLVVPFKASAVGGDIRAGLEAGISVTNNSDNFKMENSISGGVIGNLKPAYVTNKIGIQPGLKANFNNIFKFTTNKNIQIGGSASGFVVADAVSKNYGADANLFASFKPNNSNITFHGSASLGFNRQNIVIGSFNEQIENQTIFSALLGAQLKPNTTVSLGYHQENNIINPTKNNKMITFGAKIGF